MFILRGFLDRIVLLASFLVAGCVPGFIAQYRQRVGGALDQVLKDLAPFQEIANRLHGGKLEALIQHHVFSTDTTFREEGNAIQAMVRSFERLKAAVQGLDADLWHQILYLTQRADSDIAKATWRAYEPSIGFSLEALLFSAAVSLAVWLLFMLVWSALASFFSWLRRMRA